MDITAVGYLFIRILLVVLLFGFVGFTLYLYWQEVFFHQQKVKRISAPSVSITDIRAPTFNHVFNITEINIGRDPACEFHLEEATLSARHAKLAYHHNQWWIEDLNSSNGTYLNDEAVITPVVVTTQDHIRCGEINLVIDIDEE